MKEGLLSHFKTLNYKEIAYKGTVTLLVTLGAAILFGQDNMMIAFVLALGSGALSTQNMRVKTINKTIQLILVDCLIVLIAYIASLNRYYAIPLNLITIFLIIYLTVSHYNQVRYKTFMMLYVFCQYTTVQASQLPKRLGMVVYAVTIVVLMIYIEQGRIKALLTPQIRTTFKLLKDQLDLMSIGEFSPAICQEISYTMNEMADEIYRTSFKRYFTTEIGRVYFHFYLNLSYFNFLLEDLHRKLERGFITLGEIREVNQLFNAIQAHFNRELTRDDLIQAFEDYLNHHTEETEIRMTLSALNNNFKELDHLNKKNRYQLYNDWERSDLGRIRHRLRQYLSPQSMSFNFAARMSIVLTIMLYLANILGFYKFIWAIIPVMSITQPFIEDTKRRRWDRLKSNILAAIFVTVVLNVISETWFTFTLLVIAFYLYYAYKDYYHASLFLTIISMCVSTAQASVNQLFVYRILYVIVGVAIVGLMSRIKPYCIENGISDLIDDIEQINKVLEKESKLSLEHKANLDTVREAIVYSAILCQKLYLRNRTFKDTKINTLIQVNTEFVVKLGYKLLRA